MSIELSFNGLTESMLYSIPLSYVMYKIGNYDFLYKTKFERYRSLVNANYFNAENTYGLSGEFLRFLVDYDYNPKSDFIFFVKMVRGLYQKNDLDSFYEEDALKSLVDTCLKRLRELNLIVKIGQTYYLKSSLLKYCANSYLNTEGVYKFGQSRKPLLIVNMGMTE